jgi:sugar/nucleoside kinase (ribokinase family)
VVVKDGADGALRVDPAGRRLHAPAPVVEPVDTTGAGDTFDAAYVDALLDGRPAEECLARACLAGALATTAHGGTAGQPGREQLERVPFDGKRS